MLRFLPLVPLVLFGIWLSKVDLKTHRLPNPIVGWFTFTQLLVLLISSQGLTSPKRLADVLMIAGLNTLVYVILFAISRGSLGMGDVKFAFPLGLCVGWYATELWLAAIFGTFLIAGLIASLGMILKRMNRNSKLALGPYMFVSTLIICVLGM
jgi:leader peptidase (prepilin peptidase)/N-methyltransferase